MNRNTTALLLIILAIGIYFTFTRGQLAQAKAIKVVNDEYTAAIKGAVELIKIRDQVLAQYKALSEEDQERLDKMIPSTVDNIRLIIDINDVAFKHGFSLRDIKASAPGSSRTTPVSGRATTENRPVGISIPTLDTVTISFSVTAPYLEFISFLQDLEASLRIMDPTGITVSTSETKGAGVYDFSVELKTYWLRQ